MKVLHFGVIKPHPSGKGTIGDYALHVQCPWRIISSQQIVTGKGDLFEPPDARNNFDWEKATGEMNGNLQDKKLVELMLGYDPVTRSIVNNTNSLVVTDVEADSYGGVRIALTPDYRIELIPCGSLGEDWRWLKPGDPSRQFAVGGGQVLPI